MYLFNDLPKVVLLLFVNFVIVSVALTSRTIPPHLIDCYRNGGTRVNVPRNVQLLVELISKIERANANHNARTLSAALLHGLRLDGIERAPNVKETEHVTPYRASAFQFLKFSFLLDLLLPQDGSAEIHEDLTKPELCTLHQLISSSVDPWERGDERKTCPLNMPGGTATERPSYYSKSIHTKNVNRIKTESARSRCPIENGVMQSNWGAISAGTLISGISAALEPQNVRVSDIITGVVRRSDLPSADDDDSNEIETNLEFEEYNGVLKRALMGSERKISNILAATLAGDLAELIIRQGPFAGPDAPKFRLGPGGRWNDTITPRLLYLLQEQPNKWEMTDSEILAGIDAFIISCYVNEWTGIFNRLRLSQIIESYYSSYGVAFNTNIRACNRKQNFMKHHADMDLYNQTLNLANVLWFRLGSVYIPPEEIAVLTKAAVKAFENYWPKLVDSQPSCDVMGDTNAMDVVLATDGTWTRYQTEQLISILSETLDVSGHGSSLGILHGGSGEWVSTPSHSILHIFDSMAFYMDSWPNRLNLPEVLLTVAKHLEYLTIEESRKTQVAGLPRVVIIAAPTTILTQNDLTTSKALIESLRKGYSDVYFLYLMPDVDGFKQLSMDSRKFADMLIESSDIDVRNVAEMIRMNFIEKTIPKRIIPPSCNIVMDSRPQFEDYINVGQKIIYMIHPNHLTSVTAVNVQFQGSDQGEISVCVSRQYTEQAAVSCKLVGGQYEATFQVRHPCAATSSCEPVYFIIRARSTLTKCADKDCRYPDQIRFIIRHTGLECIGGNRTSSGRAMKTGQNNTFYNYIVLIFFHLLLFLL